MNHNLFNLLQYKNIHQDRKTGKGGGISAFLHESVAFNIRNDLSVNNTDIEALCVKIMKKKSRIILVNTQYHQSEGNFNECESYLNTFIAKNMLPC